MGGSAQMYLCYFYLFILVHCLQQSELNCHHQLTAIILLPPDFICVSCQSGLILTAESFLTSVSDLSLMLLVLSTDDEHSDNN